MLQALLQLLAARSVGLQALRAAGRQARVLVLGFCCAALPGLLPSMEG